MTMESLSTRELYARNTENQITLIKREGREASELFRNLIADLTPYASESMEEALQWILSCLQGDTVQREAEDLSEEQLKYASIVVSAISDCVTMMHYDKATT
jgi:hypothetical protein